MYREVGNVITKFIEDNGYKIDDLGSQLIGHIVVMALEIFFTALRMFLTMPIIKQQDL
jgi:hypothetical protein